jgi:hypothetical protein
MILSENIKVRDTFKKISIDEICQRLTGGLASFVDGIYHPKTGVSRPKEKNSLPVVFFSGDYDGYINTAGFIADSYTGYFIIDIDAIPPILLTKVWDAIVDLPETMIAFVSPSQTGIKFIVKTNTDYVFHKKVFSFLKKTTEERIGPLVNSDAYTFTVDGSGSDITRACFLPCSFITYINTCASFFEVDTEILTEKRRIQKNEEDDKIILPASFERVTNTLLLEAKIEYMRKHGISIIDDHDAYFKARLALRQEYGEFKGLEIYKKLCNLHSGPGKKTEEEIARDFNSDGASPERNLMKGLNALIDRAIDYKKEIGPELIMAFIYDFALDARMGKLYREKGKDEWNRVDDRMYNLLTRLLSKEGISIGIDFLARIASALCEENKIDTVMDRLLSLEPAYTGAIKELSVLLCSHEGATPVADAHQILTYWLRPFVHQQINPDDPFLSPRVLTLVSNQQGIGKTELCNRLSRFLCDRPAHRISASRELMTADVFKKCSEEVITIFDEIDQNTSKKSAAAMKEFISAKELSDRAAYARESSRFVRRDGMMASSNSLNFMPNDTQNRRYYVINLGNPKNVLKISDDLIKRVFEETLFSLNQDPSVHQSMEEIDFINLRSEEYMQIDDYEEFLSSIIDEKSRDTYVTFDSIQKACIVFGLRPAGNKLGRACRKLFGESLRVRINGVQRRCYLIKLNSAFLGLASSTEPPEKACIDDTPAPF